MPEDVYVQHIKGISAESANATLTEGQILTGATPGGMLKSEAIGLELRQVITELQAPPEDDPAATTEEFITWALSVLSGHGTMPYISDVDVIYKRNHQIKGGVAVYLPLLIFEQAYPPVWDFKEPLLIPHPKIYDYIISSNSSAVARVHWSLGFTYVALSGPQVMEALEVWRSVVA